MIWYRETVMLIGQPSGAVAELVGIFDPDCVRSVIIRLQYQSRPEDTISQKILYEHVPSGRQDQEVSANDILERYRGKCVKVRRRVLTSYFDKIEGIKPVL